MNAASHCAGWARAGKRSGAPRIGGPGMLHVVSILVLLSGVSCTAKPAASPISGSGATGSIVAPSSAGATAAGATFPASLVLSVLSFEDRTHMPNLAWLRKGLADMLVAEFARNPSLVVVQRDRLEEVFREQAFQLSGRVAEESAVRVGRIAGATVLVTGSVSVVDGTLRLDAQLLDVERGAVLGTANAQGPVQDVSATARSLVAKVVDLIPSGGRKVVTEGDAGRSLVQAAQANETGEVLSREGKLFQALEEFERAMAADPAHPAARSNYAKTVRSLSGTDLLRMGQADGAKDGDRRVVSRLVERLAGSGLDTEISQARPEPASDGSMILRVPVRFRLAASAVEAVLESVRALGGTIQKKQGGSADAASGTVLEVQLSDRPDVNREFVKQLGSPRRIYLRLLSTEGRTLAIYSSWREWQLATWMTPLDEQRVRIDTEAVLASEAVFAGLTTEQAAGISGTKMTVDTVPRERAILRLEVSDPDEGLRGATPQPPILWGAWQKGQEPPRSQPQQRLPTVEQGGPSWVQPLRVELERLWSPPITERGWGRGYLPSNERTAIVTALVGTGTPGLREGPRLAKASGDAEFDQAALATAHQAIRHWIASAAADAAKSSKSEAGSVAPPVGVDAKGDQEHRTLKIRIQFRILKDIPALNLIGAVGAADHLRGPEGTSQAPLRFN